MTKKKRGRPQKYDDKQREILDSCHSIYVRIKNVVDMSHEELIMMQRKINTERIKVDKEIKDRKLRLNELAKLDSAWKSCERVKGYIVSKKGDRWELLRRVKDLSKEIKELRVVIIDSITGEVDNKSEKYKKTKERREELERELELLMKQLADMGISWDKVMEYLKKNKV
jgi:hypothetical protein